MTRKLQTYIYGYQSNAIQKPDGYYPDGKPKVRWESNFLKIGTLEAYSYEHAMEEAKTIMEQKGCNIIQVRQRFVQLKDWQEFQEFLQKFEHYERRQKFRELGHA